MRALWLHYPSDSAAVSRGDVYLWGRDLLVAPVTEQGATERALYLPPGDWWDFWSGERVTGGREITREVDLETLPLYVRSGAIVASGPLKQSTSEGSDEPLRLTVYPGQDGATTLYEDDGATFNYRRGDWMGLQLKWKDSQRTLTLHLVAGSRMRPPWRRDIEVKLDDSVQNVEFDGRPLSVRF